MRADWTRSGPSPPVLPSRLQPPVALEAASSRGTGGYRVPPVAPWRLQGQPPVALEATGSALRSPLEATG
ncbi:unnamed protein product [Arctogadus glacialis]